MWVHQPTLFLGFGAPLWIDAQEAPVNKIRKQLSVLHRFIYCILFSKTDAVYLTPKMSQAQ